MPEFLGNVYGLCQHCEFIRHDGASVNPIISSAQPIRNNCAKLSSLKRGASDDLVVEVKNCKQFRTREPR